MGNVGSFQKSLTSRRSYSNTNEAELLHGFSLDPPTAAVIGGGMTGVHAAYELSRLGFQVTVFEQGNEIAHGTTVHSLPFVGVGLGSTPLFQLSLWRQVLLPSLFSSSRCPPIVWKDALWPTFTSPEFHFWRRSRRHCLLQKEDVLSFTNRLSYISREVVGRMVAEHRELAAHVVATRASVSQAAPFSSTHASTVSLRSVGEGEAGASLAPFPTAHPQPLCLDPLGWTKALAKICQEQYHVSFLPRHRVLALNARYRNNTEMIASLTVATPAEADNPDSSEAVCSIQSFDVVVIAAGSETGRLTRNTCRIPVLPVSCASLTWSASTWLRASTHHRLVQWLGDQWFPSLRSTDHAPELIHLHPSSTLAAYYTPTDSGTVGVTGLLSSDTAKTHTLHRKHTECLLHRFTRYLHLYHPLSLPGLHWDDLLLPLQEDNTAAEVEPTGEPLETFPVGLSPDSVPIIDQCGGFFNAFVCSGMDYRGPDFAPGAAVWLQHLVAHRAQSLLLAQWREVKENQLSTVQLPTHSFSQIDSGLQQLLHGHLPPPLTSDAQRNVSLISSTETWEQASMISEGMVENPYSLERFGNLNVNTRQYADYAPRSPLHRFFLWEEKSVERVEPWLLPLRTKIASWGRNPHLPSFIQNFIFFRWYVPLPTTLEDQEAAARAKDEMKKVIEEHEGAVVHQISRVKRDQKEENAAPVAVTNRRLSPEEVEENARKFFAQSMVRL